MGEIAHAMIEGELCAVCGAYLYPGETVYLQADESVEMKMPKDGSGAGVPVVCSSCKD